MMKKWKKDTGICVGSDYSGGFCFRYVCRCGGVLQHQSGTTQGYTELDDKSFWQGRQITAMPIPFIPTEKPNRQI